MSLDKKGQQFKETVKKLRSEKRYLFRAFLWIKAVIIGGAVPYRFQIDFAEELELTPKALTIWNSVIGLSISILEFAVFGGGGGYITARMAEWFDLTYTAAVYLYVGYNIAQNLIRIVYAQITKKGIAAFVPSAAAIDAVYIPYYYLFKKKKQQKKL